MHFINLNRVNHKFLQNLFFYTGYFKDKVKNKVNIDKCKNFVLANVFYEPSTRTSLSFEVAMKKLGGEVINFNKEHSSVKKGESVYDTLKTLETYSDLIVLRHPDKDVIYDLENKINKPIINAGNGAADHPTQALLDLYTINEKFNLENNKINLLFTGDIKYSRTIHSLDYLLKKLYKINIDYFAYPKCNNEDLMNENNTINNFDNIKKYDVIYCTRMQKERFSDNDNIDISKFILNNNIADRMKKDSIIMHPLPRNEEIDIDVDENVRCFYFKQMENGIYLRMALIYNLLF